MANNSFGVVLITLISINIIAYFAGIVSLDSSLAGQIISGNISFDSLKQNWLDNDILINALSATITFAGVITKRDELIYAGLITLLSSFLGIFSVFNSINTGDTTFLIILNLIKGVFVFIYAWTAIEWLRGKD